MGLHLAEIDSLECDALVQEGVSFQGTFVSNFSIIYPWAYSHYNIMLYPSGLEVTWSSRPRLKRSILLRTLQGRVRVLLMEIIFHTPPHMSALA